MPEAAGFCFLEMVSGVLSAADFALALPPPLPLIVFSKGKIENCGKAYIVNQLRAFTGAKSFIFMATTSDISRGMIIKLDGSLYSVIEFGENKTARAAAKVWAKLKGVDNNRTIEKTWNSGDNIFPVRVEKKNYQFLYKDDTGYNFMDNETFEQIAVQENLVDAPQFLKEGQEVAVLINTETEQPMSVELPDKIVMKVTYSEPGVKGDTATRTLKPATIETGATVNVPLFVNEGELIRINTKTGEYVERVKE